MILVGALEPWNFIFLSRGRSTTNQDIKGLQPTIPGATAPRLRCSRMARGSDAEFAVLMHKIMELPVAVFQSFMKFI
jgi:hypothetical protein